MEIELKRPHWQTQAQELFLHEYDDPKEFYERYTSAADVYQELVSRIMIDVAIVAWPEILEPEEYAIKAYAMMNECFGQDVANNNYEQLDSLIRNYSVSTDDK